MMLNDVGFKSYQFRTKDSSVRVMWDPQAEQPYQGDGNYGKFRYHGVGGG